MSKILALLSGKGGSGKTTLALSIASMLADCEIRTLLVDCDLSTNGATYFYESKLVEYDEELCSFYKFLFEKNSEIQSLMHINGYMDFMPSITRITKCTTESYSYKESDYELLERFKKNCSNKYDIIILDCQAGYTDLLKIMLPIVDINLVVMEADAISSSAIRSLYLKIGDYLNEKNIYQVFNKATEEEYNIYSKLFGGTVFTNIETVIFDWKIRKAFAIAEIPDMENTSIRYGEQIYNICKILFKETYIQKKLEKYKRSIELTQLGEAEKILKLKIGKLQKKEGIFKSLIVRFVFVSMIFVCAVGLCVAFYVMINKKVLMGYTEDSLLLGVYGILTGIVLGIVSVVLSYVRRERRSHQKEYFEYNEQLESILYHKRVLQQKCNEAENNNEKESIANAK